MVCFLHSRKAISWVTRLKSGNLFSLLSLFSVQKLKIHIFCVIKDSNKRQGLNNSANDGLLDKRYWGNSIVR